MASTLLKCSICPKHPDFSDISHLLTHVSSKGHLAHLHKLQVRSHQEVAAGQQLASYDDWYQQHGLGQMLSERLQQKDAKKTTSSRSRKGKSTAPKRASRRTATTSNAVKTQPSLTTTTRTRLRSNIDPALQNIGPRSPPDWDEGKAINAPADDSDYCSTPTRRLRPLRSTAHTTSTGKQTPSDGPDFADLADEEESEASKLKGLIWPGMDLFDAATDEMKRKRNQKKDGSLLKQMEKHSEKIEATETIYSPSGILRKQRPITGNVEDDSPLKGETPLPKKRPLRSKRPVLAELSGNVATTKRSYTRSSTNRRGIPQHTSAYLPSSSHDAPYGPSYNYASANDGKAELNLTLGYVAANTSRKEMTVFEDDQSSQSALQNLLKVKAPSALPYSHHQYSRAEEYLSSAPFQASRHNVPQSALYGWPAPLHMLSQPLLGPDKENVYTTNESELRDSGFHQNPLGWTSALPANPIDQGESKHVPTEWLRGLPIETSGFSSNPFSLAFQQLQSHPNDPFVDSHVSFGGSGDAGNSTSSPSRNALDDEGTELPNGFYGDDRS